MANAAILKEYLVALGVQDNMTGPMRRTLRQGQANVKQFAKSVTMAGTAMAGLLLAANAGVARFMTGLVQTDDRIQELADDLGTTHDEATKAHFALRAMGRSLEEIEASPELTRQFQQLQDDAARIQIPDISEGLNQVRAIQGEFVRLRNIASHGIQWIGHHLLKYLHQPMERLRDVFSGLNDRIIENMPDWSRRIAGVMASVVNMTASIIRGAAAIFRAIRRIFDMISTEIKILTGVLAAFIRAGPVGKLMMLFTVLMLLVEDFFTYLDGGEALLGGLWRWLIDLWAVLNEGGGFIERLKNAFVAAMDAVVRAIRWVIDWIVGLFNRMRDLGALENFRNAFTAVGRAIGDVFNAIRNILSVLLGGFRDGADTVQPFLAWLLAVALPGAIGLIADVVSGIANAISWFMQLPFAREALIGVAVAIGSVIAAMKLYAIYTAAVTKAKAAYGAVMAVITKAKAAYAAVVAGATIKQKLLNLAMMANPIGLISAAIMALIAIVVLLVRNWESVAAFFRSLWDRIMGIFRRAIDAIVGFFRGIIDWIRDNFASIALFIINPFAGVFHFLYNNFEGFRNFVDNVLSAIRNFFTNLWNNIKSGVQNFVAAVTGFFRGLVDAIIGFFTGLWERITGIFSAIGNFIGNIFGGVRDAASNVVSNVSNFFGGLGENISNVTGRIGGFFRNTWNNAREGATSFVHSAIERKNQLREHVDGVLSDIRGFFSNSWDRIRGFTSNFADSVKNFFRSIWDRIVGIFSAIPDWFRNLFENAVQKIIAVFTAILGFFSGILEGIVGIFSVVIDFFRNLFGDALDGIIGVFSRIKDFFNNIWENITAGVRAFVDRILGIFQPLADFIGGIGNRISNLFGRGNNRVEIEYGYSASGGGDLPGHASGGIFDKEHVARFAEGGKPEAVIPLTNKNRAKDILGGVMNYLDGGRKAIKDLDAGITQQAQNTTNYNTNNTYNNYTITMPSSYNINDTSGRPESVAKAVERKEQQKMRNLQGILNSYSYT